MSRKYQTRISVPEKPLETKRTKRIRVFICVLYVITIALCALPFVQVYSPDGKTIQSFTVFNMIFDGFNQGGSSIGTAIYGLFLVLLPVIGFLFESFDKSRCFKCLTGVLCPIICVAMICFGPGWSFGFGAMFSIITYLLICFFSVYLFLVKAEEKNNEKKDKLEAKPKHDFKVEQDKDKAPKHNFKIEK